MLSIEKKSKKYPGVYFRELEDGDRNYFLRFRLDGKITRIPIGRKSEGITEAFCNQEKSRIINAHRFGDNAAAELQKVKNTDPTFEELVKWYIEKREIKDSTAYHLEILYKVPFLKKKKITRQEIQAYMDELAQTLRPATVTLRYRQIRAVFRYAIGREKYKYADPTAGIDLPKGTGARKRYLSQDEITLLLENLRHDPRLYLFVKMSLCTGARIGTLLTVHSNDIQPDGMVRLFNHKANHSYTGFFDAETMELLRGKQGYVLALPGKEGKVPAMQSIQYKVQDVLNRLFNPPGTPIESRAVVHTLRHSFAVQGLNKGLPMEVISKALDHSSPVITATVYAKVSTDLLKRSVKGIWD